MLLELSFTYLLASFISECLSCRCFKLLQRVPGLILFAVGHPDAEEQLVSCSWQPGCSFGRTGTRQRNESFRCVSTLHGPRFKGADLMRVETAEVQASFPGESGMHALPSEELTVAAWQRSGRRCLV